MVVLSSFNVVLHKFVKPWRKQEVVQCFNGLKRTIK
jgi:hypothetical protein